MHGRYGQGHLHSTETIIELSSRVQLPWEVLTVEQRLADVGEILCLQVPQEVRTEKSGRARAKG